MSRIIPEYDDKPLVSVIIPCYNAEAYVGEAIESALEQSYPNVEVIVIDDGSTDRSLEVIRGFGGRVRWKTGLNRGGGAARNQGLALARGELIQFLDADDLLAPDKQTRMVPVMLSNGSDCLAFCEWERLGKEGDLPQKYQMNCSGSDAVVCCTQSGIQTAAPLHWRRQLKSVGGFDESLPCAQERDLHLRLACHGLHFVPVPEVLVRVRRQVGSVSSDSFRVLRQHLRIVQRARLLLEERGACSDARLAALAGLLARDARVFERAGLRDDARAYFREARKLHSKGGWDHAYLPSHRALARVIGPAAFERLVRMKRRWVGEIR